MGIPVYLLVINELDLRPAHYAWLSFAEGKPYEAYQERLSEDVAQNETYQIYIDILRDLEKEGKERMAYEVLSRIISEMPPERAEKLLLSMPTSLRQKWQVEAMQKMLSEQLQTKFGPLPQEVVENVQKMASEDALSDLAKRVITASSLVELGLS